ncbi:MAG: hypothetical protein GWN87_23020 [Desulfuromonadales bacterium]|nr:hypothetical protein [Desulfuromonadales bacterium]NIS42759.1 hypothetical protein [Desulfuromonadales bacterium]
MQKISTVVLVALIALTALPGIVQAMPAISCHCFQNREFDPRRPAAADDYLLTTTFNSFQALALGIDKKSIVRAKMSGQKSADIWLRFWLASKSDRSVAEIERQHRTAGSWLAVSKQLGIQDSNALAPSQSINNDRQLAEAVAQTQMIRLFAIDPEILSELSGRGASLKEMVLSLFLSTLSAKSTAGEIFDSAHEQGMSWGLVAQEADVTFSAIEMTLKSLVEK